MIMSGAIGRLKIWERSGGDKNEKNWSSKFSKGSFSPEPPRKERPTHQMWFWAAALARPFRPPGARRPARYSVARPSEFHIGPLNFGSLSFFQNYRSARPWSWPGNQFISGNHLLPLLFSQSFVPSPHTMHMHTQGRLGEDVHVVVLDWSFLPQIREPFNTAFWFKQTEAG